jgi:hypothetical protein
LVTVCPNSSFTVAFILYIPDLVGVHTTLPSVEYAFINVHFTPSNNAYFVCRLPTPPDEAAVIFIAVPTFCGDATFDVIFVIAKFPLFII